ncbi:MAG: glycogen debranching protein GlgX [Caldithrix sp.]|nr:glycogen debranching protein GlgX [Caldithrix sp.]
MRQKKQTFLDWVDEDFEIARGYPYPFGASLVRDGINFAVFAPYAKTVSIVIFGECHTDILAEFPLDDRFNRTGNIWHAFINGLDAGIRYGYRVQCEDSIQQKGVFCKEDIILLDPYSKATCGGRKWGTPLRINRYQKEHTFRLSLITDDRDFDWEADQPLNTPLKDTIIYELHVRGFTKKENASVKHSGTFKGLTEKIPYLKELGITAIELMPVTDFDETDNEHVNPETGKPLKNFWGYDPLSFFAPKASYASQNVDYEHVNEFKQMVKTFHEAGIEVILDMVFNHTGEGNRQGPVYHFKGLANPVYYIIDSKSGDYLNYSGCGNTLNCNHPVVREILLHSLRYWVTEMHVDGFRFDLASVLGRGRDGSVLPNPPIIERIAEDPILANTKLIAEAWDAAGLYQVGEFAYACRWMEWNGKFRDEVRMFVRGDEGMVPKLATRLAGSADLYQDDGREPYHSVNFITCHDGFTLNDLVSYNKKHNEANGEYNRDGSDYNFSWNCGAEGPTDDKTIDALREKQKRNLVAILLLSQGVPMILAGDEFSRTQKGNNNAYCQDNAISWVDWSLQQKNKTLLRFFKIMIQFRKDHPNLRREHFDVATINGHPEMSWHGEKLNKANWDKSSRSLALYYAASDADPHHLYIIFNSHSDHKTFELPSLDGKLKWYRVMDTGMEPPNEICDKGQEAALKSQTTYELKPYTSIVLISK